MANPPEELWKVIYDWMRFQNISLSKQFCKEEITTHADYPALTSVVDFLNMGSINSFNAVQADASYIHEFNYPLLAHIKRSGNEYLHVINTADQWDAQKETTSNWSGIVIYPEKNAQWSNVEDRQAQNRQKKKVITGSIFITASLVLFIISLFFIKTPLVNVFGFLSLIGMAASLFLAGEELGYQNDFVKQVCGAVSKAGCEAVLKSKFSKNIFGLTPADLSLIYFTTQCLAYGIAVLYPPAINVGIIISFAGLFISCWSVYTQAVLIRNWCALCLIVVAVLIVQFILAFFIYDPLYITTPIAITNGSFFLIGMLFCVVATFTVPIKALLKTNKNLKQESVELKKWKTDPHLFTSQLQQEQTVDTSIWEEDLIIGNVDAPITITVACNPYCGPCAKAHKKLDELIERSAGLVNVRIRLLLNIDNDEDKLTIATKALLSNALEIKDPETLQHMFTDWFHWMDMDKWAPKWNKAGETNISDLMKKHAAWINGAGVTYTPTFFINGKKLPGRYILGDLEKLIPRINEEIQASKII